MATTLILQKLNDLNGDRECGRPAAREQMLEAAHALVASLQTPGEFISRSGWAEPARSACLRLALDLNVFDILSQRCSDGLTPRQLTRATGADEGLLSRILKHLAAMNVVAEVGDGGYMHTRLSSHFVDARYRDGLLFWYISDNSFKQPAEPLNGPFQFAHNTQKHFFSWLADKPAYSAAFTNHMAEYDARNTPWYSEGFYPLKESLIRGFVTGKSDVFLVDVGGGNGRELLALHNHLRTLPGRLILQDDQSIIATIETPLPSDIQVMHHNIFHTQPVKGARAYFLHSVFHDWDDESCIRILRALIPAMTRGYSKVLVHDVIVPDKGAAWSATSMDLLMMALGSVKERTETDFRRLFEVVGLTIENVWTCTQSNEGLIEASLVL